MKNAATLAPGSRSPTRTSSSRSSTQSTLPVSPSSSITCSQRSSHWPRYFMPAISRWPLVQPELRGWRSASSSALHPSPARLLAGFAAVLADRLDQHGRLADAALADQQQVELAGFEPLGERPHFGVALDARRLKRAAAAARAQAVGDRFQRGKAVARRFAAGRRCSRTCTASSQMRAASARATAPAASSCPGPAAPFR